MKAQHKLLTVKEVVQILVDKEVISEKVAETLVPTKELIRSEYK